MKKEDDMIMSPRHLELVAEMLKKPSSLGGMNKHQETRRDKHGTRIQERKKHVGANGKTRKSKAGHKITWCDQIIDKET